MKRPWIVPAGVAAAVLLASGGVVAVAAAEDIDDTATSVSSDAIVARGGQDTSESADETWARGQGKGYGSYQGGGTGQGYGAQRGRGPGNQGQGPGAGQGRQGFGQGPGAAQGGQQRTQQHDPTANLPAATSIDESTEQELLYMVEEEKLAHDVYVALGEVYDVNQFTNIPRAELQHQDAVRVLLDRYGLDDPTTGAAAGEFSNEQLQSMYDELVTSGASSLADAAQVGITVETTDIADLTAAIEGTDAPDVVQVLSSLRDGSERHLAAFERLAERAG